jgi:hypothetical protein
MVVAMSNTRSGVITCPKCRKYDLPATLTIGTTKAKSRVIYQKHFKKDAAPEKCPGGTLLYRAFPTWARKAVADLPD